MDLKKVIASSVRDAAAFPTVEAVFAGEQYVLELVATLVKASAWFEVTPYPDDHWLIRVKPDAEFLLNRTGN